MNLKKENKFDCGKLINLFKNFAIASLVVSFFYLYGSWMNQHAISIKAEEAYRVSGKVTDIEGIGIFLHITYQFDNGSTRRIELSDVCIKMHQYSMRERFMGEKQTLIYRKDTFKDGHSEISLDNRQELIHHYCSS